jgi:hypothetical protein
MIRFEELFHSIHLIHAALQAAKCKPRRWKTFLFANIEFLNKYVTKANNKAHRETDLNEKEARSGTACAT